MSNFYTHLRTAIVGRTYKRSFNRTQLHRISLLGCVVLMAFSAILFTSCGNMSAEEIEEQMSNGVVLVQNKSYYELKFPNGKSMYFTSYDKEDGIQGLTAEVDSVEMALSYGTGFFVSEDGKIATNHHVVENTVDDKDVTKSITALIDAIKSALSDAYDETQEKYNNACQLTEIAFWDDDFSSSDYQQIKAARDQLGSELEEMKEFYANLSNLRPENSEIIYHNEISVGYNDTFVTKESDLTPCIIRKTDKEKDLAIIQLKDKKTPEGRHVFLINESDPLEEYNMSEKVSKQFNKDKNSQIFMPAFNLGPSLAITEDGLKLQCSSGTISRRTSDKIMYSIPSLPGSSGSPIVNQKGEVVAINSCGVQGSDSFNSGIRVIHLNKLLKEI